MAIKILYADLRNNASRYEHFAIAWKPGLTALLATQQTLTAEIADQITDDLHDNNQEIMVSWYNVITEEHSEIGGVGSLDWEIPDGSVLTIVYEDETTTQHQIDESSAWMLKHSLFESQSI